MSVHPIGQTGSANANNDLENKIVEAFTSAKQWFLTHGQVTFTMIGHAWTLPAKERFEGWLASERIPYDYKPPSFSGGSWAEEPDEYVYNRKN
jgi:hypothetical protein